MSQSAATTTILHSFALSTCSWRVRIALAMKGIPYVTNTIDLKAKQQLSDTHRSRNAMMEVPTLEIDGLVLSQSYAILEYLEDTRPQPPLLPRTPSDRALCRQMAMIVVSGVQPYQSIGTLARLPKEMRDEWLHHYIHRGLTACEAIAVHTAKAFAIGDQVTLADLCIIPQLSHARRFNVDTTPFPTLRRIEDNASLLPAFQAAAPEAQP